MQMLISTTIAITGGIGSGKSHVCRLIERTGTPVFYADPAAKQIIRTDPLVKAHLQDLVGTMVYDAYGDLDKRVLAEFICRSKECSRQVDAIVHPRVEAAWNAFVAHHKALSTPYIYMECALLFEAGWQHLVDRTVLVFCPEEERIRRVMKRDHIARETVLRWMQLQMPESEKKTLADVTLLNDGRAALLPQLISHHLIPSVIVE